MTKKEFEKRIELLKEKAQKVGAQIDADGLYDENHLDCFWYDGTSIVNIYYRGYIIAFDVCGDVSVGVYLGGKEPYAFRHKGGSQPFFEDVECRDVIPDDDVLTKLIRDTNIVFENNNWVNIVVIEDETEEYVSEPEVASESHLLGAVENNFDHYIKYVDKLIENKKKRFLLLYCQEREMSVHGVFKSLPEAQTSMQEELKKYLTEDCGVSEEEWQESLEARKYERYPWDDWDLNEMSAWSNGRVNIDWQIVEIEIDKD